MQPSDHNCKVQGTAYRKWRPVGECMGIMHLTHDHMGWAGWSDLCMHHIDSCVPFILFHKILIWASNHEDICVRLLCIALTIYSAVPFFKTHFLINSNNVQTITHHIAINRNSCSECKTVCREVMFLGMADLSRLVAGMHKRRRKCILDKLGNLFD